MNETSARFEFRAFAQTFGLVTERIRRYASCDDIRETNERYLVAAGETQRNVKIRGERLEIKRLRQQRDRLQQWEPVARERFPLPGRFVREHLLPARAGRDGAPGGADYSLPDLISALEPAQGDWRMACVFKRRFRFHIRDCPTEIDEVWINGAAVASVAVESEDPEAVLSLLAPLGLAEYENVDYPRAVRRVMGLEALPEEHRCG